MEFKTLGEVSIWAQSIKELMDDLKRIQRLMVMGTLGTFGSVLLEIVLKANHLIS